MANKATNKNITKPQVAPKAAPVKTVATKAERPIAVTLALLLGAIAIVVYINTLANGYALDDTLNVVKNKFVLEGFGGIGDLLSTPYHRGSMVTSNDLYRPLSLVTFAMENQLFGKSPGISHFINVIIFAGCVMLLFLFLNNLWEQKKTSAVFIAALLFALHPIHTEVVANIKSRDELLCFFFAFLSLYTFGKYANSGKMSQLLIGSLFFMLSLFSKETVITFLAVIPLVFLFVKKDRRKAGIAITISSVVMAIVFLAVRHSVLAAYDANHGGDIAFIDNELAKAGLPAESRIATALLMLGYYLRLLLIPYPLVCDYSFSSIPLVHMSSPAALVSLAIYVAIAVYGVKRFLKDKTDPYAFGILFFLLTISLFSNIFFPLGATMGERFLFFPSVGFCIVLGFIINDVVARRLPARGVALLKQPLTIGALAVLGGTWGALTISRSSDWVDNYTLYSADVKKMPDNARINYYLGSELEKVVAPEEKDAVKKKQIISESISYLKKSVTLCPDFREAQSDLGAAYFRDGQYDSAELHAKIALAMNPSNIGAVKNLAAVYGVTKRYAESIAMYEQAIKIDPTEVLPYTNIGLSYLNTGRLDSSIFYLRQAIAVDPKFNAPIEFLASAYHAAGANDSARKYEEIARRNNHDFKL